MLDGNVFNSLADDNGAQTAIRALIDNELLCIIVPAIVMLELSESPFKGIPKFFPVSVVPDSVAIAGLAIAGLVCPGEGEIFSKHLGESKKAKDAILADAANATADFLVSDDNRCRRRLNQISKSCKALNYMEFSRWLSEQSCHEQRNS